MLRFLPRLDLRNRLTAYKRQFKKQFLTTSDEASLAAFAKAVVPLKDSKELKVSISKPLNYSSKNYQIVNGCDLTPIIEAESLQTTEDYTWPMFNDVKYNKYLRHFMFSFKNIYSENIN